MAYSIKFWQILQYTLRNKEIELIHAMQSQWPTQNKFCLAIPFSVFADAVDDYKGDDVMDSEGDMRMA